MKTNGVHATDSHGTVDPFEPENLRISSRWLGVVGELTPESLERRRKKQAKRNGEFLRGPVPIPWLVKASKLPGKALTVGVAIWFEKGMKGSDTIKLRPGLLDRFELSRTTRHRALTALEDAGLVSVVRHRGKSPEVTVLVPDLSPA